MTWRALLILLISIASPAWAAKTETQWVEAVGYGTIENGVSSDSARRSALAEALISAAISGGANLQGYTAMDKGRIVADLNLLRPTGSVQQHRVVEQSLSGNVWRVKIHALVGVMPPESCIGRRRLDVIAYAPRYDLTPYAPAWVGPMAQDLFNEFLDRIERHRATDLTRATSRAYHHRPRGDRAMYDYATLTRGSIPDTGGEHAFTAEISANMLAGDRIEMTYRLTFIAPDGNPAERILRTEADLPGQSAFSALTGSNRTKVMRTLIADVGPALTSMVDGLSCMPPTSRAIYADGTLQVPIGRKHGLKRNALAFTGDPKDPFAVLEIVKLSNTMTTLKPLDASRSAASFAGEHIYFFEADL